MDIYYETLFNFFVGGLVIGSITFCVRHLTPELGALVWAAPILLLPSVILLHCHGEPNDKLAYFTILALPYLILTVIWQIGFYLILSHKDIIDNKYGFLIAVFGSILLWCIVAYIFYTYEIQTYFIAKIDKK